MIEHHTIIDNFTMLVSDEPTAEFDAILNTAKQDTAHPLYKNYQDLKLEDFLFYNIILYNNKPAIFYGTQRESWIPDHAARVYSRLFRDKSIPETGIIFSRKMLCHLKERETTIYKNWFSKHNIKTFFFSRNLDHKEDATKMWKLAGWKQYPYVCKLNYTYQFIYWDGEEQLDFLIPLHDLDFPKLC